MESEKASNQTYEIFTTFKNNYGSKIDLFNEKIDKLKDEFSKKLQSL